MRSGFVTGLCLLTLGLVSSSAGQQTAPSASAPLPTAPTAPAETSRQITLPAPTMPAPVPIDAAAVALLQKSLAALGGVAIQDATLTGSVTRTVGPDTDTGTITMKALGTRFSRVDLSLPRGTVSELRGADAKNAPVNTTSGLDGAVHPVAGHNGMTDAVWFLPQLTSLAGDPTKNPRLVISYAGQETRNGVSVQHLHFYRQFPVPAMPAGFKLPPPDLSRLTACDIYLDSTTFLPVALTFATHPEKNSLVDIPVDIEFSNYQHANGASNGPLVPFHMLKFLNGTLTLDITIQSATINSGLTSTEFAQQ